MMIGVAHSAYAVHDMKKALEFYCEGLGLKKMFSLKRKDGSDWIEYIGVNEKQFIELFYCDDGVFRAYEGKQNGYHHLCLEVDDMEKTVEELHKRNVKIEVEPDVGLDNNIQCWVRDPDGQRIELMQFLPEGLQFRQSR